MNPQVGTSYNCQELYRIISEIKLMKEKMEGGRDGRVISTKKKMLTIAYITHAILVLENVKHLERFK